MDNSEEQWTGLLENPEFAHRFFESAPLLSYCDLPSIQIDERGRELSLRVVLQRLPDKPLLEWVEKKFNTFGFFLTFANLQELDIEGWLYTPTQNVEIELTRESLIRVAVRGEGMSVRFTAGAVKMTGGTAYRASSIP
ncbi:Imm50 family immunity protein [Streptomyces sp. NPDC048650]|uniref:Imm50 family immunity protein n=1 Tax=unclassified Streptomyces TaxID=2593676 RepID=UPI00372364FF